MTNPTAIQQALEDFASGLHLEEEELPAIFDVGLLDASLHLEDTAGQPATALREATRQLVEEPSADAMAEVLSLFARLIVRLRRDARQRPVAAEWMVARQLSDLSENIARPRPAENQGFAELPRLLMESEWLQKRLRRVCENAGLEFNQTPAARGLQRANARRWIRRLNRHPEGKLSMALEHLLGGVEYRARQVWVLRRSEGEEQSMPQMYVYGHVDLFPNFHSPLSEGSLALEVAMLKGLAHGLQLQDLAYCFDSAEWMGQYALSFLLPPSPSHWPVHATADLRRLLSGRLSRWYFCPFDNHIQPLEMATTVLRVGRPLFYERVAAHALLEYSLLQGVPLSRANAGGYLEIQAGLESEFQLLFDGYLLRLMFYPQLKKPEGWRDYLGALDALHFGGAPDARFAEFRQSFLSRRGLHSPMEILYRAAESHSALN
ncbi:MAG: hypothetical protein KJZ84_13935 [Bryobacteraceae bacterium]|nr:hypothetical protein [Bryobacteraceae bacterium]